MKLEDVLALIRAGYTREEIAVFENPEPSVPENKPTTVPTEQPAPENKPTLVPTEQPAPEKKPTPVPNDQPTPTTVQNDPPQSAHADLKAIIAQAVKEAMQAQAIATSNQPNPATPTAEECLAAMLR